MGISQSVFKTICIIVGVIVAFFLGFWTGHGGNYSLREQLENAEKCNRESESSLREALDANRALQDGYRRSEELLERERADNKRLRESNRKQAETIARIESFIRSSETGIGACIDYNTDAGKLVTECLEIVEKIKNKNLPY